MRNRLVLAAGLLLGGTGCIHLHIGASQSSLVEMHGLASAHVALTRIQPFHSRILDLETFKGEDWVSLRVWPIADLGIGFVGVRARLLILDVGAGVLGYDAGPWGPPLSSEPREEPPTVPESGEEEAGEDVGEA